MKNERNVISSEAVDTVTLDNRYTDSNEALGFVHSAKYQVRIALKFAIRNATNVQMCQAVCKEVKPNDPIHKMAIERMSVVGRNQIFACDTVESALEIADIAIHDPKLQNIAIYRAVDLLTSFDKIEQIIDKLIDDKALEEYFWDKALKIARSYADFDLIIDNVPRHRHLWYVLNTARLKQKKALRIILENKSLNELGELYYDDDFETAKKEIRNVFVKGFNEKRASAISFESHKELFRLFEDFGKPLVPVRKANVFLEPMLRLAESFSQAQFVYNCARNNEAIRILSLIIMKDCADNEIRYRIVTKKPEFDIIEGVLPDWLLKARQKIYEAKI